MSSDVVVNVHLNDDVRILWCGDHSGDQNDLSYGQYCTWDFCAFSGIVYNGDFTWGSINKTVEVFNKHIGNVCYHYIPILGTVRCYWLVREEGFYVSRYNKSFPDSEWKFQSPWN